MTDLPPLHARVEFGKGIPHTIQGPALLAFERILRELAPGQWIEVFKDVKGDDSKLRNLMTADQRRNL